MAKFQKGVGLIEVLITVLVLSTGLMALAALQTRSLQYNSSAFLRSQANIIASDIFDRMRIVSSQNGGVVTPSEADVEALVATLPGGEGEVGCDGRICTVTVTWTEPTANVDGDELETTSFTYMSRI
ncbi:MAG TPA: type IV pilus modification protein PilV [Cellvibrionaceae bacterium]